MQKNNISSKILGSGFFDADWYLKKYGYAEGFAENPLDHFQSIGIYKGLNPSVRFDSDFYLKKYPDVAQSKTPPFLHYLMHGIAERRLPFNFTSGYRQLEEVSSDGILRTLDLGCGLSPRNPFKAPSVYGVDIQDNLGKNIRRADLAIESIPFEDDFFGAVTAYDFIEHIPRIVYAPNRRFSFVELMNEIYRVLIPGGLFLSHTPAYPAAEAFRDPTHVNIITEETFPLYFDDNFQLAKMYGFKGSFKVEHQSWDANKVHLDTILKKCPLS